MATARFLLLSAILAPLLGCSQAPFYTGDGRFTDHGWTAYSNRYVIDLNEIDLSVPGKYSFTLSGLPRAEMNVSIRVFEATKNEWAITPRYDATVRMELRTVEGEIVIREEGSLNRWVRSFGVLSNFSDLYRRGDSVDIPLAGGGTRGERRGVKASGGWGTYFNAEKGKVYVLDVEVLSTQPSMKRPSRVMVIGWDRVA